MLKRAFVAFSIGTVAAIISLALLLGISAIISHWFRSEQTYGFLVVFGPRIGIIVPVIAFATAFTIQYRRGGTQ